MRFVKASLQQRECLCKVYEFAEYNQGIPGHREDVYMEYSYDRILEKYILESLSKFRRI